LGVFGLGGHARAYEYLLTQRPDVLLVVGSSLNEFASSSWEADLQPQDALIHVDVDPEELGKNYPVDVEVVGDARAALRSMNECLATTSQNDSQQSFRPTFESKLPRYDDPALMMADDSPMKPQRLMKELREALPPDGMLFVDAGNCICWGGHYFEVREAGTYFIDLGLACMGSSVAAAIGGKIARPASPAVALVGDAAFAMHGTEVHTAVELRLPVVWIVLNNGGHGMVIQGERMLLGRDLGYAHFSVPIDAAGFGRSLGARGHRVDNPAAFRRALEEALASDGPTVIDAIIDPDVVPSTLARRAQSLARFFDASHGKE
jgi:acetolactate synthase-1/2/3 large subunit